ncbi:MAG: tripartite tricarboxylate transporter substrate-binding protein [Deltaproteobacteria bacterium]|nr:tripartite tricarboxylate transporter substrate-binding protein [Deltaproteobacteria bacterium]
MSRIILFCLAVSISGFTLLPETSPLTAAEPYYKGKTIRILVSSSPGGGTDSAGRLVARFLPKYLPGEPDIIIQNMPGGGGVVANNYFNSEAKPDGLTILQDSTSTVNNFVRGGDRVKYDPRKYKVIAGLSRLGSLFVIRNAVRERLTNRKAEPVVVGDSDGSRGWLAILLWGAEYIDWNVRFVYGYPGTGELVLALRQGEIDVWATGNTKLVKDLIRDDVVSVFATEEEERREDFPEVPTFLELLGNKQPTGVSWQAYQNFLGSPDLDKFIFAPEGTPDNLVALLKEGVSKTLKNPEVKKQGDRFFGAGWKSHSGEKIAKLIRENIEVPKEAKEFIRKMRKKYNLPLGDT